MNFQCRILEWYWRSIQSYIRCVYLYVSFWKKKTPPSTENKHQKYNDLTKSLPRPGCNVAKNSWPPFPQPKSVGETSSFSLVLSPRGTSWTVFRAWLPWVAWVRLEEFFGVKQVLETNGWSLNNPLIRPYFLEVVGILVPLNSHENKDITNTVLKKKVEYN